MQPKWRKVPSLTTTKPGSPDTYAAAVPKGLVFLELFQAALDDSSSGPRLIPARNPNGNPELDHNNFQLRGKATACKDFGPATQVMTWHRYDVSL